MRISDWSSDVCSSDLSDTLALEVQPLGVQVTAVEAGGMRPDFAGRSLRMAADRLAVYVPMRGEVEAGFRSSDGHPANNPAAAARLILALSHMGRHTSEEHTSELQSLLLHSYAVCRSTKKTHTNN